MHEDGKEGCANVLTKSSIECFAAIKKKKLFFGLTARLVGS